jgi:hypothetical protein
MMSKVAHEWRDHEGAQRYASTAVVCLVHNKPKKAHPKSKEEAPNYNATTDNALTRPDTFDWPCKYYISE